MKKIFLVTGLLFLFSAGLSAQNPTFVKCATCIGGKEAAFNKENWVEFYLAKPDVVRDMFEFNNYKSETVQGFCSEFYNGETKAGSELLFRKCETYFMVIQQSGTRVTDYLSTLQSNYMRTTDKGEKWYSISHKKVPYKFIVWTRDNSTYLKVVAFNQN
ncbi:MAG: hypothetical protein ACT6QS_06420 [Flavobacteriales bacterium]